MGIYELLYDGLSVLIHLKTCADTCELYIIYFEKFILVWLIN